MFFVIKTQDNVSDNDANNGSESAGNNTVNGTVTVKSTEEKPILLNEVEATNIEIIRVNSNNLEIHTTLKNNSDEDINGFFIVVGLLDKDGNQINVIAQNSEEVIKANSELVIYNNASVEDTQKVVDARMITFEKTPTQNSIENAFDEMIDEVPE